MKEKIAKLKLALADAKTTIKTLKDELRSLKTDHKAELKAAKGVVLTPVVKKAAKPAAKKAKAPTKAIKAKPAIKKAVKKVAKKKVTRAKKVETASAV